ncbi:FKBP-type peptidyl-prolyl cis-trans isomerase [Neptuniibacter caesariensis]|uniref:Peptidyl-prolyl cis-trans isomerase n=1 Tax=Neptuniibacter caesariensis TaxID=207954 RepID=A0A7U8C475_NEPCE|nr:peptidylprolyl isomerase [Neptuniibacter caesariensis]EAR59795.1 Peptidylprolyl isomerase, FKBP-type [Oceanospirillum sp. MED92] [Neptuniibacter caesariensis]
MKVSENKVVLFHYALVNSAGEVLDGSRGGNPLPYLHGHKNIVPGLEAAMDSREVGDKFEVVVPPEQGYGQRDEAKVQVIDSQAFADFTELEEGMVCQMEDDNGELQLVGITKIEGEDVTVDANHPFAGIELKFDVEIMEVRDATAEELSAGHVELD